MPASRPRWFILLILLWLSPAFLRAEPIGAVLAGRTLFWSAMGKGIRQAATDFGVRVSVRSPIDDDAQSVAQALQIKMLQHFIRTGAEALILAPMPVRNSPVPVELSVPLVLVDRPSSDFEALSTISTDNYAAGRAAALSLRDKLGEKSKVGVFRLAPDVVSTTAREQGFIAAAKDLGFEVVLDIYLGHGIREAEAAANLNLSLRRQRIDAIFGSNDRVALAAVRAFRSWPRDLRPLLVGFDYESRFEGDLRNGDLYAIVVQNPFEMGYRAVEQLVRFRRGEPVAKQVYVDVFVVTAANLGDSNIRRALDRFGD